MYLAGDGKRGFTAGWKGWKWYKQIISLSRSAVIQTGITKPILLKKYRTDLDRDSRARGETSARVAARCRG
jgi:hypothetical protein